ncbi:hypothetical protein BACCIP111899_02855 [Bacillus rhizoplanae]|uniref:Uncharacterized protein n=1 Tax=Bacillus rhizoplanae TaxID=2880966 RepID=A0ABN8A3L8_9BACI|nr:hypothetical protein [Bacillus rhizoplanae]CAG9613636.1 hypothetical protein BACCIP111899_02855 [Bacillus rhizoplanae]
MNAKETCCNTRNMDGNYPEEIQNNLINRINRIEGQVKGIKI